MSLRKNLNLEDKFIIGYAGTVGISHGLEILVNGFERIDPALNAHLVIIGSGAKHSKLKLLVEEKKLTKVLILEAVPKSKIEDFMSIFDACLISLKDIPAYDKVIPSKLFEAAAYNKPVIAGLRGEAKSIVKEYGIGEVFRPENILSFVNTLTLLISNLKGNANYYSAGLLRTRQEFSRDRQAHIVLDCIKEIG